MINPLIKNPFFHLSLNNNLNSQKRNKKILHFISIFTKTINPTYRSANEKVKVVSYSWFFVCFIAIDRLLCLFYILSNFFLKGHLPLIPNKIPASILQVFDRLLSSEPMSPSFLSRKLKAIGRMSTMSSRDELGHI